MKSADLHFPPPLVFAIALGAGWLLGRAAPLTVLPPSDVRLAHRASVFFLLAALALAGSALAGFRHAGTSPIPFSPSSALVTTGIYRFTRNPMYLGLACLTVAIGLLANSLWMVAGVVPSLLVIRYAVITKEETYLAERFGDAYRAYCARVRRWL